MSDTYRIKIGDLEYPGEFSDPAAAASFAYGARFVLDNSGAKTDNYPPHIPITMITYANEYDYDNNVDTTRIIGSREF